MAVNLRAPLAAELHPVAGLRLGVTEAAIRKANRRDLTVLLIEAGASVAAVFTRNRFFAAPIQVCREHLGAGAEIRALVINTGNANAGTGADGVARARSSCAALAQQLGLSAQQVLPFSTGVIMEPLPVERIEAGLAAAIADAREDNWLAAAHAIMTTDTVPKAFSAQAPIGAAVVCVTGISKGAGMIRPNMATMLGFMATDACVAQPVLQQLARELADASFNRVTVDGDTSTNDSFVLIATNKAAHLRIDSLDSADGQALKALTLGVAKSLAQAVATPANAIGWPAPSRIRRWSRPHFLPVTPTSGASWLRWVTPVSTTWSRRPSSCSSTTCTSPRAAGAIPRTAKRTGNA